MSSQAQDYEGFKLVPPDRLGELEAIEAAQKRSEAQQWYLRCATEKWGHESQTGMAIEECAEFIVAARKLSRVGGRETKPEAVSNIIDEIADVTIMMRQMAMIFGEEAVNERIRFKIQRLAGRLELP